MPPALTPTLSAAFRGRRVLVTGHTGFKGSWLCQWLLDLGAQVHGFALDPEPHQGLFDSLGLAPQLAGDTRADLLDGDRLGETVAAVRPEFLFHLAAQPLVRRSYREPLRTLEVNAIGSARLLEALRSLDQPCAAVMVTTDKVYDNREWLHGYREADALGGVDPYSASKACAEIIVASWRRSFFGGDHPVRIASARAGNVIGGGDWAQDRIVPDAIRALAASRPIRVRNARATRPWQHVLEPLGGYLTLAARLAGDGLEDDGSLSGSSFNFGPPVESNRRVGQLVEQILCHWPGSWQDQTDPDAVHEAGRLHLSADKAWHQLGWAPRWDFARTVAETVAWYRTTTAEPERAAEFTRSQIAAFTA